MALYTTSPIGDVQISSSISNPPSGKGKKGNNPKKKGGGQFKALQDNLVSAWTMDAVGTRVDQVVATGNDLLDLGSSIVTGKHGNATKFVSTSSQRVDCKTPINLYAGDRSFTAACWVRMDNLAIQGIMGTGVDGSSTPSQNDWGMYYHTANNSFRFATAAGSNWHIAVGTTFGTPVIGEWNLVIVRYDNAAGTVEIKVNDTDWDTISSVPNLNNTGNVFQIGGRHVGAAFANNTVDSPMFWDTALSDDLCLLLYNEGDGVQYSDLGVKEAAVIAPGDVTGLITHLDASNRGSTSNQWDDLSGEANHWTASTGSEFPVFAGGTATFDASAFTHLDGPNIINGLAAIDVFLLMKCVSQQPPIQAESGLVDFGTSGSGDHYTLNTNGQVYCGIGSSIRKTTALVPVQDITEFHIVNVHSAASDWAIRQNGAILYQTASNTVSSSTAPILGMSDGGAGYLEGEVIAMLIYNNKVSDANRSSINAYLRSLIP